jgi:hypothetical protein
MADGEHESAADEDVKFAEVDFFDVVEVPGGPQDDEQGVAVPFEFRPLVGDDGVFDGEVVQPELICGGEQLVLCGPAQADPGDCARLLALSALGISEGVRSADTVSGAGDAGVDDALLDRHEGRIGGGPRVHRDFRRRFIPSTDVGSAQDLGHAGSPGVGHNHLRQGLRI